LEFKVREVPTAFVLSVKGEIDLATAPEFHRQMERVASNGRHVVVDLSQVGFMDLRGIRILETFHNGLSKKSRRLVLCVSSYSVHRILELTEVDKHIAMFPSIEAALDSLEAR
jgi:anti-sigma B factor antagonist